MRAAKDVGPLFVDQPVSGLGSNILLVPEHGRLHPPIVRN